jgi:CheY-like chemotaxis protein
MADAMLAGKRLLVVEDEIAVLMLIEDMLDELGCVLSATAGSVATALARLEETEGIEAALLDINLGGETSYPVASALQRKGLPFVFVTGYGEAGLPPGFEGNLVLQKPFRMLQLESTLVDLFQR